MVHLVIRDTLERTALSGPMEHQAILVSLEQARLVIQVFRATQVFQGRAVIQANLVILVCLDTQVSQVWVHQDSAV